MNLLVETSVHEYRTEDVLFKEAFEYFEVRLPKKKIVQLYLDYLHQDKIPDCVQDYCLELLSGRLQHP